MKYIYILAISLLLVSACGTQTQTGSNQGTIPASPVVHVTVPGIPLTYHPWDGFYTVDLLINGRPFNNVIVDTGSSNLVLLGDSQICPSCLSALNPTSFTPSTFTPNQPPLGNGQTFYIQYGIGQGNVRLFSSTVGFNAVGQVSSYPLGVFVNGSQINNILGLGFADNSAGLVGLTPKPFLDEYMTANGLSNLFTMNLCPGLNGGSFMTIGSIPNNIAPNSINYTRIIPDSFQNTPIYDLYNVQPSSIWVAGENTPLATFPTQNQGYLTFADSGTTLLYLPSAMLNAISAYYQNTAGIPPSFWNQSSNSAITINGALRSQLKTLQIEFPDLTGGSFKVDVTPETYTLNIGTSQNPAYASLVSSDFPLNLSGSIRGVILGDVFFQNNFMVFDRTNLKLGMKSNAAMCPN